MADVRSSAQDLDPHRAVVRVYRLGKEPGDDPSGTTTAEARVALVWELSSHMWALTGKSITACPRDQLSSHVVRPGSHGALP